MAKQKPTKTQHLVQPGTKNEEWQTRQLSPQEEKLKAKWMKKNKIKVVGE